MGKRWETGTVTEAKVLVCICFKKHHLDIVSGIVQEVTDFSTDVVTDE